MPIYRQLPDSVGEQQKETKNNADNEQPRDYWESKGAPLQVVASCKLLPRALAVNIKLNPTSLH